MWSSDSGWHCTSRLYLEGEEPLPENRNIGCTDTELGQDTHAWEGTGGVVALKPGDEARVK